MCGAWSVLMVSCDAMAMEQLQAITCVKVAARWSVCGHVRSVVSIGLLDCVSRLLLAHGCGVYASNARLLRWKCAGCAGVHVRSSVCEALSVLWLRATRCPRSGQASVCVDVATCWGVLECDVLRV